MLLQSFFKQRKKQNSDSYIAIDIGTEFVKTVIYKYNQSTQAIEIIGYSRVRQSPDAMYAAFIVSLNEAIDKIDKSIKEAIQVASSSYPDVNPRNAIVGIAGELVQGMLIEGRVIRKKHTLPITEDEINQIKKQIHKSGFDKIKNEVATEMGIDPEYIDEIATYLNSCYVDGVKVSDPIKFTAKELLYKIYITFAPTIHISTLKQIFKQLKFNIHKIVVEPYAISLAIQGIRNKDSNGIIIDVGGGTTDVAIVHEGSIVGTKMFAIGSRVISKMISKELNIDYLQAEELKIKYSNNTLKGYTKNKISRICKNFVDIWLEGLEVILDQFDCFENQSYTFYLCGGGALLPDVYEGLLEYPWVTKLRFGKQPKIDFLFPNQITNVVDLTKLATSPMDVTVLSLARMHIIS
ncbi:MAG: ethanolamine ammonia-lyase reactivating factor EutA [Candidatus Dojkabacteria bacterium]|nr:ethanolamine ammonia-lyase reactivating factor EutA [Candidatus Dojkabacteria bacterium]